MKRNESAPPLRGGKRGVVTVNANICDFGAVSGGTVLCTKAIQAAVDACAASGGGRVIVPPGLYLTGTVWLRDNVELHLQHGSTLKASTNMDDYNALDAYPQNFSYAPEQWVGKHLILAVECKNVALTGSGTLDGSADHFMGELEFFSVHVWRGGIRNAKDKEKHRPGQLVCFVECEHVLVENVTLTNCPCWGCFLHGCEYVTVHGVKVFNPDTYGCTDGIDIDCCRFVTVSDCIIDTGDDGITIRGNERPLKRPRPCEYVTVTNCVIGVSASAFRIGVGRGKIRHVRISNITVTRGSPLYMMTAFSGVGGVSIEDVTVSNVSGTNCLLPMKMYEYAGVPLRNITLENFVVEADSYFELCSFFPDSTSDITLRNWRVILREPPKPTVQKDIDRMGTYWFRAKSIRRLTVENFVVEDPNGYLSAWRDGAFLFEGCDDRRVSGVEIKKD